MQNETRRGPIIEKLMKPGIKIKDNSSAFMEVPVVFIGKRYKHNETHGQTSSTNTQHYLFTCSKESHTATKARSQVFLSLYRHPNSQSSEKA